MKKIKLRKGFIALVDDEDYEILSKWEWRPLPGKHIGVYAARSGPYNPTTKRCSTLLMHREIMRAAKGVSVDHINGNKLDNRKSNLRLASSSEQQGNRALRKDSGSGFKGVSKRPYGWVATINKGGTLMYLGFFKDKEEAAKAYDRAAKEYFKEFAFLNFPEEI